MPGKPPKGAAKGPAASRRKPGAEAADVEREPAVSVLLTTFDSERHVREAVASIVAQDMPDWELVVVDDGSTDATLDIVASFRDPRIRILRVPRCGRIPALNLGVQAARAPFVAIQDSDDVSLPHRLRVQLEAMRSRPRLAMLGAGVVPQVDEDGRPLEERRRPTGVQAVRRHLGHSMAFMHSSCMYRRDAILEAGGFDASLPCWEDYDMAVRLAGSWEVDNLPQALALKRRHAAQAFDTIHFTNRSYRARARILRRYLRHVRPSPVVAARSLAFMVMGPRLRIWWLRLTKADPAEVARARSG